MRCSLKFACEALSHTAPNWIAMNRTMQSQPRPASAYCHVRSLLFWDITKCWVVIPYWCFGTTYQFHLQGSKWINNKVLKLMAEATRKTIRQKTAINFNTLLFYHFYMFMIFLTLIVIYNCNINVFFTIAILS
jgi:hypothetical protein